MCNLRLERTNTIFGLVLWLAVMLGLCPLPLSFDWPLGLILLGSLVLIPIARILLLRFFGGTDNTFGKWASWLQVPAGICLLMALVATGITLTKLGYLGPIEGILAAAFSSFVPCWAFGRCALP